MPSLTSFSKCLDPSPACLHVLWAPPLDVEAAHLRPLLEVQHRDLAFVCLAEGLRGKVMRRVADRGDL
eukprot:3086507-Pyramimonas_sp.AAC.1